MIQIRELRKSFGSIAAVRGVSLTAHDGRITGVLGENGAGKTTMLALTCGLLRPDEGSIQVGPDDCSPLHRRSRIGALLDHKGLYDRLTARENIEYFGRLHGMSGKALPERVNVGARLTRSREMLRKLLRSADERR